MTAGYSGWAIALMAAILLLLLAYLSRIRMWCNIFKTCSFKILLNLTVSPLKRLPKLKLNVGSVVHSTYEHTPKYENGKALTQRQQIKFCTELYSLPVRISLTCSLLP